MKITLAELKTNILDQADMTGSEFIQDAQLTYWINSSLSDLHDILISKFEDYFLRTHMFSYTAGTMSYILPDDLYKLIKVYWIENTYRYRIPRFMPDELDLVTPIAPYGFTNWSNLRYRLLGDSITFIPENISANGTVELWYIPQFKRLVNDTDEINYSVPVMWEDYVVCDVAARCLEKEESDPSLMIRRKNQIEAKINSTAPRDIGEPARIQDTYNTYYYWDGTYGA